MTWYTCFYMHKVIYIFVGKALVATERLIRDPHAMVFASFGANPAVVCDC